MPNWCDNTMTVSHPDPAKMDALKTHLKALDDYNFSDDKENKKEPEVGLFGFFKPMPKILQFTGDYESDVSDELQAKRIEETGHSGWYGWCVDNWGTKWEAQPENWDDANDDGSIQITFMSAWSPPTDLYDTMVEDGWSVDAHYYEPGMAFVGRYTDGFDDNYEIDFSNEDWRDEISQDIIDWWDLESEYEYYKEMVEENEEEVD